MAAKPLRRREFGYIRLLDSERYQASFTGPDLRRHFAPIKFETKDLAVVYLRNEKRLMEEAAATGARWLSPAERADQARRVVQR